MEDGLKEAIKVATEYHKGQFRKNGLPYITHPLAVMDILRKYNFPEDALIAAVLHDTGEDTNFNNINLNKLFGPRVGFIVNALSKNKKPKDTQKLKEEYKKQSHNQVSELQSYSSFNEYRDYRFHLYINRLYMGIIADPWIFFIKIADQVHNLGDMESFSKEKVKRKIDEIEHYFIPIYNRLEETFKITKEVHKDYLTFMKLLEKSLGSAKNKYL